MVGWADKFDLEFIYGLHFAEILVGFPSCRFVDFDTSMIVISKWHSTFGCAIHWTGDVSRFKLLKWRTLQRIWNKACCSGGTAMVAVSELLMALVEIRATEWQKSITLGYYSPPDAIFNRTSLSRYMVNPVFGSSLRLKKYREL